MSSARSLAPVVHSRAFEMHDLDVDAAFLRNVDSFRDRFQHVVGFIAQVSEIARVASLEHPT
jgi:hypothetical protein